MNNVQDRIVDAQGKFVHWDFKKVLGTIIHIAKEEGNEFSLICTLSQIKMCELSKLINLLYVVQDDIIVSEADETDYTKKSFSDFEDLLETTLGVLFSKLGDKAPLAIMKWRNDYINKQDIEDPEQWCGYTTKVQGIFNKIFAEHIVGGNKNDSYHFTDGLGLKVISPLIEKLSELAITDTADDIVCAMEKFCKRRSRFNGKKLFRQNCCR